LHAGSDLAVPLDVEFDQISVRPVGEKYEWSELKQSHHHHGVFFCARKATGVDTGSNFAWACVAVVPDGTTDHWLNLYPPCHFENLLPVPVSLHISSSSLKTTLFSEILEPGHVKDHYLFAKQDLKDLVVGIGAEGYKDSKTGQVFPEPMEKNKQQGNPGGNKIAGLKRTKAYSLRDARGNKLKIWGDHFTDAKTR
jgi:hypothetical protein